MGVLEVGVELHYIGVADAAVDRYLSSDGFVNSLSVDVRFGDDLHRRQEVGCLVAK